MDSFQFARIDRKTKKILEVIETYTKPDNTSEVVFMPIKTKAKVEPEDLVILDGYVPLVNYASVWIRTERRKYEEKIKREAQEKESRYREDQANKSKENDPTKKEESVSE